MRTIGKFQEKEAASKINKKVHSAAFRNLRIMKAKNTTPENPSNKNHCGGCGFRVRGKNHLEGAHHNGQVAPCHRGR